MSGTGLSTLGHILIPVTVMATYQVGATVIYVLTNEQAEAERLRPYSNKWLSEFG